METELAEDEGPEGRPDEASQGMGSQTLDPQPPEDSIDAVDRLLDEVEGALSRLDDGTYGVCGTCGGPIEDARLAASPTTQTCSNCLVPEGI